MPTFLPRMPVTFVAISISMPSVASRFRSACYWLRSSYAHVGTAALGRPAGKARATYVSYRTHLSPHRRPPANRASSARPPSAASAREYRAGAYGCGSQTAPATSYPRAANAARSTYFSSWAMESAPRSVPRYAAPSPRFRRSTDPECDSRKPSTGCEFFLFQSRFTLSNPSRRLRKERTSGKPQAAFARVERALLPACRQHLKAHGQECPRHTTYCTISEIVPAPTVCPPSRIAKRKPFSI